MPDQDSTQDSNDRSILDSGGAPSPDDSTDPAPSDPANDAADDSDAPDETGTDDLHFEDDHLGEKLRTASDEELDDAPFGIIKVDDEGTVEFFNQYEADLSGMDPDDVTGRNFFTQVAPCTNNRLFRGRFKKGVRRGDLDETFTYTYTYKMRPTLVDVHLFRDEKGNNWITVQKY
jgi:photoactive yellow protein